MSWHFSQALEAASLEGNSSDGKPSAPSKSRNTADESSCNGKTMESLPRSQSGTMCEPSTASRGVESWMSSLVASRARTSAPPAKVPESVGNVPVCGQKWRESSVKFDPGSHSWKTHQCLWDEDLPESSVTLPRWGMMRGGVCWERITLPLLTSATASGSWPTIRSTDGERGGRGDLIQAVRGNENSHYRLWPTPNCSNDRSPCKSDAEKAWNNQPRPNGDKVQARLQDAAAFWPTPHGMSKDGKSNGPSGNELGRAVNQREEKSNGGSLNPPWVEWLMGWPIGWTDSRRLGTDRFRQWSRLHGRF